MTDKKRNSGNLKLLGGRLCLDFVNTLDWRGADSPVEFLNTFEDLVAWSRHVGTATSRETGQLSRGAEPAGNNVKKTLKRAIRLREAIYQIFAAVIQNKDPAEKDLALFNRHIAETMRQSQIIRTKDGYIWDSAGDKRQMDWLLNPIIRSAAELLVSDELKKVKSCADPACGWLFLDVSRNQSRRWCDMQDCGNRAKASRFYRKRQSRI